MSLYSRPLSWLVLCLAWIAPSAGCATVPPTASMESFAADGIHVRHLRVRLAPSSTKGFEAMMKRSVEAATAASLPDSCVWLCYREPPGRYWIVLFSNSRDGFAVPETLAGFVDHVGLAASSSARAELNAMLAQLEYETEWEIVLQQKGGWSTVREISTETHPKARIMDRTIRPGMEVAFDAALEARTAFLAEHGYPLPIEGFVTCSGAPGRALQVVFPVDWSSFHGTDSFHAFVRGLDATAQEEYGALKAALMVTMSCAEYEDGNYVPELSYGVQ